MRITIVTSLGRKVSGQARVLLEYARCLQARNHRVLFYRPATKDPAGRKISTRIKLFAGHFSFPKTKPYSVPWFKADFPVFSIPFISDRFLPDSDILIFSLPSLVSQVSNLSRNKGELVFLAQCGWYAQKPVPNPSDKMNIIAISTGQKEVLTRNLPGRKIGLLVNGVNIDRFSNPHKNIRPAEIIGMIFYQKKPAHKGLEDGLKAFEIVRRTHPHLKLRMAGEKRERWLPGYVEFWDGNNQDNLLAFYRSLDIFLYPSRLDACPLTPMEALACKCGLVTTGVSGISDFTVAGRTALVSPTGDVEKLAGNLAFLVENPEELKSLSLAGHRKISEFSYENQTNKLLEMLKDISGS